VAANTYKETFCQGRLNILDRIQIEKIENEMDIKKLLIQIKKKTKIYKVRRAFIEIKYYLFFSVKSGELVFGGDFDNGLYRRVVSLFYSRGFDSSSGLAKGMEYVQYAVCLKNAFVLGTSDLIALSSGNVLFDSPFYDVENRLLYTDERIMRMKHGKITYWKGINKQTIDKAVWMGGFCSVNYYHFMYEFAIKFRNLNALDIPEDVSVLIDQKCLDIPQFKEILDILNEKKYHLRGVAQDGFFEVKELFYINCQFFKVVNCRDGVDIRTSDFQFDMDALKDLRGFLLPHASLRTFPKRIFVSRKNTTTGWRRFNEDELIQVSAEFGFEVVYPEKLSFREQMGLFNRAEWIIGGSGAAFANLLFCNPYGKAIIVSKTLAFSGFTTLAQVSGVNLHIIAEMPAQTKVWVNQSTDFFKIDVSSFRQYLIDSGC
jgi:hypothetical protein